MDQHQALKELMTAHLPPQLRGKADLGDKLDTVLSMVEQEFGTEDKATLGRGVVKNLNDNPNFLSWMARTLVSLSDRPLEALVKNLILGTAVGRGRSAKAFSDEHGYSGPITLVINPTMRCNIRCVGCYAYNYTKVQDMAYDTLAKVLREAREMNIRFITLSGGEPLLYPELFRMAEEFSDLCFLMYTNSTLIDEPMAARIAEMGNIFPGISVEGFRKETDARRGEGVHDAVCRAMDNLRRAGVFFGFSATPTHLNADTIASDAFVDYYIDKGALFGWIFSYIPIGRAPDLSLVPTPEQRDRVRRASLRWQTTRPVFIGDFWNDGACTGGCMSASRYCYISVEGYAQPCTFVQFYKDRVQDKTLQEIFASDFFRAIRDRQPYHSNLLRPCKVIDHPEDLRELVQECDALPAYPGAEQIVEDPKVQRFLDEYSEAYGRIAQEAWEGPDYQGGTSSLVHFLGRINVDKFYKERMDKARRITARKDARKAARSSEKEVA